MEPARIESLLDHGCSLIGQLHQWLSCGPEGASDRDALGDLIRGLQLLWAKADDLDLKRLARSILALEQFFERCCARKLEISSELWNDVTAGISVLEDLLLGLDATREEPAFADIESLQSLEKHTLHGFMLADATRTIEISAVIDNAPRVIVRSEPIAVHPDRLPVMATPMPKLCQVFERMERPLPDMLEQFVLITTTELEPLATPKYGTPIRHEVSIVRDAPSPRGSDLVESRRILILEESLFYRHLIGLALQSAGYDSDAPEPLANELLSMVSEPEPRFCAILVTPSISSEVAHAIERLQRTQSIKVFGLTTAREQSFALDVDDRVLKSNPLQLIAALNRLLNPSSDDARKIA